jgi:hypothetical protein
MSQAMMLNTKEDAKDVAQDTRAVKSNNEHGQLTVTNLEMVSISGRK